MTAAQAGDSRGPISGSAHNPNPSLEPDRSPVERLRQSLKEQNLDGLLVPQADEYGNEYLPDHRKRLAWLTGFTGSAGAAVVLPQKAALFVDGRYTLQAAAEIDRNVFEQHPAGKLGITEWLTAEIKEGERLGYDPWLHNVQERYFYQEALQKVGAELVATLDNPIDALWYRKPIPPAAPFFAQPLKFAGKRASEKLADVQSGLAKGKVDAIVLTSPPSIAWLFNIRGDDVIHTPLPLCFAIVTTSGGARIFCPAHKVTPALRRHLGKSVKVEDGMAAFVEALLGLGEKKLRVQVDATMTVCGVVDHLAQGGAEIVFDDDPCLRSRAIKNPVELQGMRSAHERDGAALTRFLAWIKETACQRAVSEIEVADVLDSFRREADLFTDLSFATIAGAGPNGAIVHYHASEKTNRLIEPGTLLLLDSGGQYRDGTTDVTRTMAIGPPTQEMRDRFTRVLKGHIALAAVRFPEGTTGHQLDCLARQFLWQAGLDYDHGTGHGVGSYLGVHEGPHGISRWHRAVALAPGMVVSNEPGYYKEGEYGIRIENLVAVKAIEIAGAEHVTLGFENLTLAPIDLDLVDASLMTRVEIAWLNDYHHQVKKKITRLVDAKTAMWLVQATRPLSRRGR